MTGEGGSWWRWDRSEVGGGVGRGDEGGERGGLAFTGLGVDTHAGEGTVKSLAAKSGVNALRGPVSRLREPLRIRILKGMRQGFILLLKKICAEGGKVLVYNITG